MHKRTLSRADLVHDMGREIGFSKSEAKSLINAVLNEIASALRHGGISIVHLKPSIEISSACKKFCKIVRWKARVGGQGLLHFQGDGTEGVIEAGGRCSETLGR